MAEKHLRAYVDRFEGDCAIVLLGEEGYQALWPVADLPEGVREGSVLSVTVRIDSEETRAAEDIIESLIDRLQRGE